jgi:hypothetical protein
MKRKGRMAKCHMRQTFPIPVLRPGVVQFCIVFVFVQYDERILSLMGLLYEFSGRLVSRLSAIILCSIIS